MVDDHVATVAECHVTRRLNHVEVAWERLAVHHEQLAGLGAALRRRGDVREAVLEEDLRDLHALSGKVEPVVS